MRRAKQWIKELLQRSERYTKMDMRYVARGSFWIYIEKGAHVVISVATLSAFAYFVPKEVYGQYRFVLAAVGIAGIFTLPGVKKALIRSVSKGYEGSLLSAFRVRALYSLAATCALVAGSAWYAYQDNMLLATLFAIVAVLAPMRATLSVYESFFEGKKRFDKRAIYELIKGVGIAAGFIPVLYLTDDVVVIVSAFFVLQLLFNAVFYILVRSDAVGGDVDAEMVPFGKHLTVMGAIGRVAQHADQLILWEFLGPAQVAVYSFAKEPISKVKGFIPLQRLALPKLSEHGVQGSARKKKIFSRVLLMFVGTIPAAAALAAVAPYIFNILFPQYMDAVVYFQALTALIALLPMSVIGASLVAEAKTRYMYINKTTIPVVRIGLFVVLVPFWGIWGIVAALVISQLLGAVLGTVFFWRM